MFKSNKWIWRHEFELCMKQKQWLLTNPPSFMFCVFRFREHDRHQGRRAAHVPAGARAAAGLLHGAGRAVHHAPLLPGPELQARPQRLVRGPSQVTGPDIIILHSITTNKEEGLLQQKLRWENWKYLPWEMKTVLTASERNRVNLIVGTCKKCLYFPF